MNNVRHLQFVPRSGCHDLLLFLVVFLGSSWIGHGPSASAADWPTFMHNAQRSGVSNESLPTKLAEHWVYRPHARPRTAWPPPQSGWTELPKVDYDNAYYAVADQQRVYFSPSRENRVCAVDATNGQIRWNFFTGGAVRLAPTLAGENVYFGCDDGKVYCLRRVDGSLVWSYDATQGSRLILGRGQITSLWPVRTGVLVFDGRVYFGSGIFPTHKPSVTALDAATGELVWNNDQVTNYGGFSPQGYLLSDGKRLFVPSGRATPVCLDNKTGEQLYDVGRKGTGKGEVGGTYALVHENALIIGTQNTLYRIKPDSGEVGWRWSQVARLLATERYYFFLQGPPSPAYGRRSISSKKNSIACFDRKVYHELPNKRDVKALAKARSWRFAHPGVNTMIAAGARLVVGGEGEVFLLDQVSGEQLWTAQVEGRAVGLADSHGRLLVSTDTGNIYCFAAGNAPPRRPSFAQWQADEITERSAEQVVAASQQHRGFALLVGKGSDTLACALAKKTELQLTCILPEAQQVAAARKRVDAAGLYGWRVTVQQGTPEAVPYPDYAANLIVLLEGQSLSSDEILRTLRPCGGVLLVHSPSASQSLPEETLKSLIELGKLTSPESKEAANATWSKMVRGELPGSGWWTHQYADAGNRGSSDDARIKGRLDVLWYGEPGGDVFPDRHKRGSAPLVSHGKVFCQGWNHLSSKSAVICFDAYNGLPLWTREVADGLRLGLPAVSGNLACDDSSVLIAAGSKCVRLNAQTGQIMAEFEVPLPLVEGKRPAWAYLAVADGLLLGSAGKVDNDRLSDTVFAFDLATGKLRWKVQAKEICNTTLAVSSGRLIYADNRTPPEPKQAETPSAKPDAKKTPVVTSTETPRLDRRGNPIVKKRALRTVVALDLKTGEKAWESEADLTDCGRWGTGGRATIHAIANEQFVVFAGAYSIYAGGRAYKDMIHGAVGVSTTDGKLLWSSVIDNRSRPIIMGGALLAEPAFYELATGTKALRPRGNSTRLRPWTIYTRSGGCGSLAGCQSMVFGRGGYTIWRYADRPGGGALIGMRPGCVINVIPAGGVVVQVEASSGCSCYQAVQSTVVLRPPIKPPQTKPE